VASAAAVKAAAAPSSAAKASASARRKAAFPFLTFSTGELHMRRTKPNFWRFDWADLLKIVVLAMLLLACFSAGSAAQEKGQETFSSPEEASQALLAAAQNNDENPMLEILGQDAREIVFSGDPIQDAENHTNFARKYREMHRFVREPNGSVMLYIGAKNWPAPIPLATKGNAWFFDTEAGKAEILFRRIGRNELSAIRVCQSLWLRKRNITRCSTANTPSKSTVMKASTMASTGRFRTVSPRARSVLWLLRPSPRATRKATPAHPLLIAAISFIF